MKVFYKRRKKSNDRLAWRIRAVVIITVNKADKSCDQICLLNINIKLMFVSLFGHF